jgi:flagellar FliJ protein
MEPFKFKLQKVLEYKETIEEEKKEQFVIALKSLMSKEKELQDCIELKKSSSDYFCELKSSADFQSFTRYIDFLDKKIDKAKYNVEKAKEVLEIKKQDLIKSTSDRKILDKLKEQAKHDFDFENNRKEQKQNDDFALFSFIKSERR